MKPTHLIRSAVIRALIAASMVLAGCGSGSANRSAPAPQLFDGMGPHTRTITTRSPEAQQYFNQGLTWAYAFNHDEAIRSFTRAARLDPLCAMAWWGVALCHGPHINNPVMTPERRALAWNAAQAAQVLAEFVSPVERDLIAAVATRYSADVHADRALLDKAYAEAMVKVHAAHPGDADIATLTAEALMDLQPWDLWTHGGEPKGRTTEILALLEDAQRINPSHPGALHLYIHATEASPGAARAVPAADRLRELVPVAGHLVHMPSHIDVRVGRWDKASEANIRASNADAAYYRLSPHQGFYRVYMAHNHHFLAYSSMMEGRAQAAADAARAMVAGIPPDFLQTSAALIDPYSSIEYQVMVRFGQWDKVLASAAPDPRLPVTTALWRFARATALAAKNDVAAAEAEQAEFRKAAAAIPAETMTAINKASAVLAIAEDVLAGEIAFRKGNIDEAVAKLRTAAQGEDSLVYMEPPEWIQPVRHSLGAILLASGRTADAEAVYRDDLNRWPENGWSLFGLSEAQRLQNSAEASATQERFRRAWARADTTIPASCLCVR